MIYGVTLKNNISVVTALDFHDNSEFQNYFPLLPISEVEYREILQSSISNEEWDLLFGLKDGDRFRNANEKDPRIAYADCVAETAFRRVQSTLAETTIKEEILEYLKEKIKKHSSVNWFFFAVFSFTLSVREKVERESLIKKIDLTWKLADELCKGLKQIIQNSIQHSEKNMCFLSFCLRSGLDKNDNIESVEKEYPNFSNVLEERNINAEALEVLISDLNSKQTIVDSFVSNLQEEMGVIKEENYRKAHRSLIEIKEQIEVSNFFSYFRENNDIVQQKWIRFRQEDLSAHVGLNLFAIAAEKCRAAVRVISTKSFGMVSPRNIFYSCFGQKIDKDEYTELKQTNIIPGTQFSILIPIIPFEDNVISTGFGQMKNDSEFCEDYETFAKFIDFKEERMFIKRVAGDNGKKLSSFERMEKFHLTYIWRNFWKKYFSRNILNEKKEVVYNIDFDYFCIDNYFFNENNVEVCVKGIIGGLEVFQEYKESVYLAFTNVSENFIDVFRKLCILFGVREFPKNLQLYLCGKNHQNAMLMFGTDFEEAIMHSYLLSLEHGIISFSRSECNQVAELKTRFSPSGYCESGDGKLKKVKVFPFDVVLSCSEVDGRKIFEDRIECLAEKPLDQKPYGYKLENTHMRLGSKVHIESFYEMSFLFYRTTIANRIAFLIVNELKKNEILDIKQSPVIFYGYASYSKAILTSCTEILKAYRKKDVEDMEKENAVSVNSIAFASYQHNLQSESEEIQMYFGFSDKFPGTVSVENKVKVVCETYIIQIVPISSTLTTFEKMWNRFYESVEYPTQKNIKLLGNYTAFWVADKNGDFEKGKPSDVEENYWTDVYPSEHRIVTRFNDLREIKDVHYFMRATAVWHDPLSCELCYPKDVVLEIPMIETDSTSTVPTQQIRWKENVSTVKHKEFYEKNNKRLLELENCILYGHFRRRNNHYQYYIDTQKYFYKVKNEVKDWLIKCKGSNKEGILRYPELHIIFSPEHNTNVGFAQHVNTYYFNGCAEIVSLNVDKQFRSNFKCEHAGLIQTISELNQAMVERGLDVPVKFYFVDDTIITGETFEKANSFLHSLITDEYQKYYPSNLINKCFLLLERLSDDTKRMYVNDVEKDFLSFLHIDISNTRTQGDSCIGCKLEQDAEKLFKRSATKANSDYWADKIREYQVVAYDDKAKINRFRNKNAFERMIISHVMKNLLHIEHDSFEMGSVYDTLLEWVTYMIGKDVSLSERFNCQKTLIEKMKGLESVVNLIKIISRPFFNYDFKVRLQVMTFLTLLTEFLIVEDTKKYAESVKKVIEGNPFKDFLQYDSRIEKTMNLALLVKEYLKRSCKEQVCFIQDCLLESLVDLRSTYIMRKTTLKKMYDYIYKSFGEERNKEVRQEFWFKYSSQLHRLIACNIDETKALWVEYLCLSGYEYNEFDEKYKGECFQPQFLYDAIVGDGEKRNKEFFVFCHEVFIQNTGILFDGLKKFINSSKSLDNYFMEHWRKYCELSKFQVPKKLFERGKLNEPSEQEKDLFKYLVNNENMVSNSVEKKYRKLLCEFRNMITEKYQIDSRSINIALLTDLRSVESKEKNRMLQIDIVTEKLACEENFKSEGVASEIRYIIKERLIDAIDNKSQDGFELEKNGYTILEVETGEEKKQVYVIIYFDNPKTQIDFLGGRKLNQIEKVYLYLSFEPTDERKSFFYPRFILRDVLAYRNRILCLLEKDFSGDTFARYAHTIGERNILAHEKANSHTATSDDVISLELFVNQNDLKNYKNLDLNQATKWLLLRNYTNGQIAKVFNRVFSDSHGSFENAPQLYLPEKFVEPDENNRFKKCLKTFSDLGIMTDQRFKLIDGIAKVKYDIKWEDKFIDNNGLYLNLEYFKCILIDVFMSAIKYKSDRMDFLFRVDNFLEIEHRMKHDRLINVKRYESKRCVIEVKRESGNNVDYLVIQNKVDRLAHDLSDWEARNEEINRRLSNPLDYADGHMSLLAIKRFIEGFRDCADDKVEFKYVDNGNSFVTRLPILERRDLK